MRARCPIRILHGMVYCWAKATAKEIATLPEFYRTIDKGYPAYVLMMPWEAKKLKRQVLRYPRPTGCTTMGEDVFDKYIHR